MSLNINEAKPKHLRTENIKWMILSQINLKSQSSEIKLSLMFHHLFHIAKFPKQLILKESNEKFMKRS